MLATREEMISSLMSLLHTGYPIALLKEFFVLLSRHLADLLTP